MDRPKPSKRTERHAVIRSPTYDRRSLSFNKTPNFLHTCWWVARSGGTSLRKRAEREGKNPSERSGCVITLGVHTPESLPPGQLNPFSLASVWSPHPKRGTSRWTLPSLHKLIGVIFVGEVSPFMIPRQNFEIARKLARGTNDEISCSVCLHSTIFLLRPAPPLSPVLARKFPVWQ